LVKLPSVDRKDIQKTTQKKCKKKRGPKKVKRVGKGGTSQQQETLNGGKKRMGGKERSQSLKLKGGQPIGAKGRLKMARKVGGKDSV